MHKYKHCVLGLFTREQVSHGDLVSCKKIDYMKAKKEKKNQNRDCYQVSQSPEGWLLQLCINS